ncbi:acyl-CoA thioesterase [Marinigracilibium pacificum]|uniref:Acyl-CoA thioesterase n=1 Tax=Marinigracilibium pacificum TaxID=2729599 RepID=A0A848IXL4_9BACT|nr:acyl-CoA thioesterase [Marinigracilibium pacificum]NMM49037.1 acyl-CoA thioesterase [Marinigracilibium pacificum]
MSNQLQPRPVKFSATTITELMLPSYANFGGKIHGGYLLSMMDKVAYACSSKHSGAYCVTVSVNAVDFLLPVEVGDLVSMLASVNYVGNTSMVVGIKVIAENVKTGEVKHTNTSYFTMVAKDENGNTVKVPPLLLESSIEVRRFVESIKRKALKEKITKTMNEEKITFDLKKELHHLKGQRCILSDNIS